MKKLLTLLVLVSLGLTSLQAQDYHKAIGLKAGGGTLGTAGINFKTFISSENALDLTLSFGNLGGVGGSYYSFTGLYEVHTNAFDVDALNWYYGGGLNINMINYSYTFMGVNHSSSNIGLGVLGVLGIEYTIPDIPVCIALDIEPGLFYNKYNSLANSNDIYFGMQGALAIRYVID